MRLRYLTVPGGGKPILVVDRLEAERPNALEWLRELTEPDVAHLGARLVLIMGPDVGEVELGPTNVVPNAVLDLVERLTAAADAESAPAIGNPQKPPEPRNGRKSQLERVTSPPGPIRTQRSGRSQPLRCHLLRPQLHQRPPLLRQRRPLPRLPHLRLLFPLADHTLPPTTPTEEPTVEVLRHLRPAGTRASAPTASPATRRRAARRRRPAGSASAAARSTAGHLAECPVADRHNSVWVAAELDEAARDELMDGDRALVDDRPRSAVWLGRYGGLEQERICNGCKPRDALAGGSLCEPDHLQLLAWLDTMPWLFAWLNSNVAPTSGGAARQDWQRPGGSDGSPAPLRVAVVNVRDLLVGRLHEIEDWLRDVHDRPARDPRVDVGRTSAFIRAWLTKLEEDAELAAHAYELLQDLIRRAKAIAPWEDRPRRISGIPCPHCNRTTLEVRPGMEDVTCRTCRTPIPKQRYEIWTRMLAEEVRGGRR